MKRAAIFLLAGFLTFLMGVAVARLASRLLAEPREPSPWQVLLSFQDQDLGGLDDESRSKVRQAVVAVTNQQDSDFIDHFRPALFGSITNTSGEKRYLLIEEEPLMMIPAAAPLRVHVFDNCGRLLSKDEFSAGWRIVVTGLRIRRSSVLDQDTLIVDVEGVFGVHQGRQYYALIGNQLGLIYSDMDERFYPNDYQDSNMTVGPTITRSADEWENALQSPDKAQVLTALIWLSGDHWNGQPAPYDDDKAEAEKVTLLRSRDSVRKRLKQLSESEDYWIRTVAAAALER